MIYNFHRLVGSVGCYELCDCVCSIVDRSDEPTGQSMHVALFDEKKIADSGEMCSGLLALTWYLQWFWHRKCRTAGLNTSSMYD